MDARRALIAAGELTLDSPAARAATEAITGYRVPVSTLAAWASRGIVEPSFWPKRRGRYSVRRYTIGDLKRLVLVARLRQAGMSMQRVRLVLDRLAELDPEFFDSRSLKTLVVSGGVAVVRGANDPDVELMTGQAVFRFDTVEFRPARAVAYSVLAEQTRRRARR